MTIKKIKHKADHDLNQHQRNIQAIMWKTNNQDVDIRMFTIILYEMDNYKGQCQPIFLAS